MRKAFERHPLFLVFVGMLFAAILASMIVDIIELAIGPEIMTQYVRENIVLFYVTAMLSAQAVVGFRTFRKKRKESGWLGNAALWLYSFAMALLAFVVFASAVITLIYAIATGDFSPFAG